MQDNLDTPTIPRKTRASSGAAPVPASLHRKSYSEPMASAYARDERAEPDQALALALPRGLSEVPETPEPRSPLSAEEYATVVREVRA